MHYSETDKHVLLSLTEACNLNCTYCFEKYSRSKDCMDVETAVSIIEAELTAPSKYSFFKIDLFGGEPFLEFEKFKQICERIWSKEWNRNYIMWTTTNGTLVHGEIKDWLAKNAHRVSCGLSLDGPKWAHDLNRSNSFDKIDYDFFAKTWPERHVRAVIYENTVADTFDNMMFLHFKFKRVNARMAFGFDWSQGNYVEIFREQVKKLTEYYIVHPEIEPATFVNLEIDSAAFPEQKLRSYCGLGQCTVSYSPEGKRYPCPQFQAICKMRGVEMKDLAHINIENAGEMLEGDCKKCLIKNICRTCVAGNFQQFKSFKKKSLKECGIFKIQAYATALIKEACLMEKYGSLDVTMSEEDAVVAKAIANIKTAYETNTWFPTVEKG